MGYKYDDRILATLMPCIRMTLEYDGTDFVGWQFQTNGRSVQEEIEKALQQILQEKVRITGAGRTDAGVHARGQVASFSIEQDVDVESFRRSMNAVLPHDVVLREVRECPNDFHARNDAIRRRYKYVISQEPTAIHRKYCWQVFQKIDGEKLQTCAGMIQGEHDFQSFCKKGSDVEHYRCVVQLAEWTHDAPWFIFEITADRFLYGMVRALVGTMITIGRGHTPMDNFSKILKAKDRAMAGMSAPAKGLFLEEISYS
jgi:tRNA pseudouridine38-40 synthase